MIYLVFNTLKSAETALKQIDSKVRLVVQNNNAQAVDIVGLIPRNAATNQLVMNGTRTTTWAIIQQTNFGKFVFPKITEDYHPLFKNANFMQGMTGYTEEEYNPNWFLIDNTLGGIGGGIL